MTWREFFDKYNFKDPNINPIDLTGFVYIMDHIYLSQTKEQAVQMMEDFYDNADEIFNSLNADLDQFAADFNKFMQEISQLKEINQDNNSDAEDDDTFHYDA